MLNYLIAIFFLSICNIVNAGDKIIGNNFYYEELKDIREEDSNFYSSKKFYCYTLSFQKDSVEVITFEKMDEIYKGEFNTRFYRYDVKSIKYKWIAKKNLIMIYGFDTCNYQNNKLISKSGKAYQKLQMDLTKGVLSNTEMAMCGKATDGGITNSNYTTLSFGNNKSVAIEISSINTRYRFNYPTTSDTTFISKKDANWEIKGNRIFFYAIDETFYLIILNKEIFIDDNERVYYYKQF